MMRWEQYTKPHSSPQPGHCVLSYFYTPALSLLSHNSLHRKQYFKSLERCNNLFFFSPERLLLFILGKHGLLQPASSSAVSHPPGIPSVHTGQGFSSHLCGLHFLTHTDLAMPSLVLPCVKQLWKNQMLSLLFCYPLSSLTQLLQCISFQSFSLPSPFWKAVSV